MTASCPNPFGSGLQCPLPPGVIFLLPWFTRMSSLTDVLLQAPAQHVTTFSPFNIRSPGVQGTAAL